MRPEPRPQEIYRHFKGNVYQIITLARHSDTGEKMVVYQQLHAPYGVYTRSLEKFMSRIDTRKYPDEKQLHRFSRIDVRGEEPVVQPKETARGTSLDTLNRILNRGKGEAAPEPAVQEKPEESAEENGIDAELLEFLDADSYEKKLQILRSLRPRVTDSMIDTMAVSLETEIKDGEIETRYAELKNYLLTMERFECNRLRP